MTSVSGEIHKVLGRAKLKESKYGYEYSPNFHVFSKQLDRVVMVRTLEHIHVPPTSEVLVPTRIFQNKAINLALIQYTQSKSASTSCYMVATTLAYIENGFDHMPYYNEETLHIPPENRDRTSNAR